MRRNKAMSFKPSKANKSDISNYMEGSCHDFACAIHNHTGWPLLLVYDKAEPSIENERGEKLHWMMHVACLDPNGNVWDVTGCVDRKSAGRHFRRYMTLGKVGMEVIGSPDELQRYIGFGKYQSLAHQYPSTLAWADRDARRILRELHILPAPMEFMSLTTEPGTPESYDYFSGISSLNLAIGIATHFGYPVMMAFDRDGTPIRAWTEDFDGTPIVSEGMYAHHQYLELPEDCSVTTWEVPHHAMADIRIRDYLGTDALNTESVAEAFADAQKAFSFSIVDTVVDRRKLTEDLLQGYVRELLEEAEYDEEYGGLTRLAATGKPHSIATEEPDASQILLQQ
jgi:hypothetical protein